VTQKQRIDKTIEIAARLAVAIVGAPSTTTIEAGLTSQNVSSFCVQYAKAIISEAEKEDAK